MRREPQLLSSLTPASLAGHGPFLELSDGARAVYLLSRESRSTCKLKPSGAEVPVFLQPVKKKDISVGGR
jgi:hypothetical protein